MRRSTLDMLSKEFQSTSRDEERTINKDYVVSGEIPKALGSSLADQIRNRNNAIRNKITY